MADPRDARVLEHRGSVEGPPCPRDLLRRRGTPYDELGLDDERLSDATLIAAMAEHPILIERPVVRGPRGTRLCRPPERVKDIL